MRRLLIDPGLREIRSQLGPYVMLNVLFYGLVLAGVVFAFVRPETQRELLRTIVQSFAVPPLSVARDAYLSGNVLYAAAVTFLVNTVFGSFLSITLPSIFIPFAGSFIGLYRALLWGVAFAPSSPELAGKMVPHSLVLILEGQGYVLAMFGVHLLWTRTFAGIRRGVSGLASGYAAGLRGTAAAYGLLLVVLAVAAVYEAIEIIYIVGVR